MKARESHGTIDWQAVVSGGARDHAAGSSLSLAATAERMMSGESPGTSRLVTRRWRLLPWALVLIAAAISIADLAVIVQNDQAAGRALTLADAVIATEMLLLPFSFAAVGAFVVTKRPGNRIGWLMIAIGVAYAVTSFNSDYPGISAQVHRPTRPFGGLVFWLSSWDFTLHLFLLLFLLLLFPTGELPSRRWKPLMWFGLTVFAGLDVLLAVKQGPIGGSPVDNPFGVLSVPDGIVIALLICGFLAMAGAVVSLVLRFRTARGDVRQQLKWFTYGGALAIACQFAGFLTLWSNTIVAVLAVTALTAMPFFMGVAILRYRLYDIDVLINRTLVYGLLSASLGLFYLAAVISLQTIFRVVVGQGSDLAIAISTLAIAALFQPLRRRIQAFIDRRFYRRKYDATRTLTMFQTRLRNEVDLDQLAGDLLGVVQDTMQPAHVSLWLRSKGGS